MECCRATKKPTTRLVSVSFSLILISSILFNAITLHKLFYVAGEIFQLSAFVTLLIAFILVLKR